MSSVTRILHKKAWTREFCLVEVLSNGGIVLLSDGGIVRWGYCPMGVLSVGVLSAGVLSVPQNHVWATYTQKDSRGESVYGAVEWIRGRRVGNLQSERRQLG